jgi:hypothetical protein
LQAIAKQHKGVAVFPGAPVKPDNLHIHPPYSYIVSRMKIQPLLNVTNFYVYCSFFQLIPLLHYFSYLYKSDYAYPLKFYITYLIGIKH